MELSEEHAYYFKFNASIWLDSTSKVQLLSYEEKGIFVEFCAMLLNKNGKIKHDEMLHRKLRLDEAKLTNWLNLVLGLNLLVSDNGYLSVKFINEALSSMKEKRRIYSENGKKGGRPKSKRKLSSNTTTLSNTNSNTNSFINQKPSDVKEVLREADRIGYVMTKKDAMKFIANYDVTGWIYSNGQPIRDWKPLLMKWKLKEDEFNHKKPKGGTKIANADESKNYGDEDGF